MENEKTHIICNQLYNKSNLKIKVYDNTLSAYENIKKDAIRFVELFHDTYPTTNIIVRFEEKQSQSFYLQFGSDILFFMIHSNVFEFNRDHEVMKTPYIKEDKERSFCGVINIYNFLTDSLLYDRYNDLGYLIGRIFVNKDNHYYIDGKREIGQIYNNFSSNTLDENSIKTILDSAIEYTINFDLLVPPYDSVQEISVHDMIEINNQRIPTRTAKRLGFRFQADTKF